MEQEQTPPAQSIAISEKIESIEITTTHVVTQEIVNARFAKELTALKYEDALQKFTAYKITPDNLPEAQEKMKKVRAFLRSLGAIKDAGKRPALEECRYWDTAYKNVLTPLEKVLSEKDKELQVVTNKIAEENRQREAERQRVFGIEKDIDNTLLMYSQQIAGAKDTPTLVTIEKLLGSLKGNKSRFQEFLPKFVERCGELTPLIKKQKEVIKELEELERQRVQAEKEQDDRKLLELQEKQEVANNSFEENKIVAQEIAIQQAIRPDIQVAESVPTEIKYRRQSWKWEVKDIKTLAKKAPHLVIQSPDEEKIDDILKAKKADGSLKNIDELDYMGIRFFLEKLAGYLIVLFLFA